MTWLEVFLLCFTVILAVWRRPPITVNVYVGDYDDDDGDGDDAYFERIPDKREERTDVRCN